MFMSRVKGGVCCDDHGSSSALESFGEFPPSQRQGRKIELCIFGLA